jgi:hypothetical protein
MTIPSTIAGRKKMLQALLRDSPIGPSQNTDLIRSLFRDYYTPDPDEAKYNWQDIVAVTVEPSGPFAQRCFHIHLANGARSTASLKRLAGEKPSATVTLNSALRAAIQDQITHFRRTTPLDPLAPCPVLPTHCIGTDAEVDHVPPFASLRDRWLQTVPAAKVIYNQHTQQYRLSDAALEADWSAFHQANASLRYLSKEGNARAHRM